MSHTRMMKTKEGEPIKEYSLWETMAGFEVTWVDKEGDELTLTIKPEEEPKEAIRAYIIESELFDEDGCPILPTRWEAEYEGGQTCIGEFEVDDADIIEGESYYDEDVYTSDSRLAELAWAAAPDDFEPNSRCFYEVTYANDEACIFIQEPDIDYILEEIREELTKR